MVPSYWSYSVDQELTTVDIFTAITLDIDTAITLDIDLVVIYKLKINVHSRFSSNFEAKASKSSDNLEEIFYFGNSYLNISFIYI